MSSLPHWEESPKTYSEQQTRILAKYKYQNISTSKHLYGGWTNYISLSKYQCNCLSSLVDVTIFCQDCETFACYTYPGKKTRRNACLADLDSIFLCGYLVFSYVFVVLRVYVLINMKFTYCKFFSYNVYYKRVYMLFSFISCCASCFRAEESNDGCSRIVQLFCELQIMDIMKYDHTC